MKEFAVIKNGIVTNIAVADSIEIMGLVLPNAELVVEATPETGVAYVGADYRDGRFIPVKPAASWKWDAEKWHWVAPKPYPQDGNPYDWDETARDWVALNIPEALG